MRNKDRIPIILDKLKEIWELCPELRLGQLILNVIQDLQLYYIEDEDLIAHLGQFYYIKGANAEIQKNFNNKGD